jgi:hypothetical protein
MRGCWQRLLGQDGGGPRSRGQKEYGDDDLLGEGARDVEGKGRERIDGTEAWKLLVLDVFGTIQTMIAISKCRLTIEHGSLMAQVG